MKKRTMSRESLADLYVNQGMSQRQIGERLGVGTRTVGKWLRKDGVDARPKGAPLGCNTGARKAPISREDLEALYITKGLTQRAIAALYGLSEWGVGKRLRAFGIESRPTNYIRNAPRFAKVTADELRQLYVTEGRSQKEIAELYGMNPITVSKWLRRYCIPIEAPWNRSAIDLDPEELQRLHQEEALSLEEIAAKCGCSLATIRSRFKVHGLKVSGKEYRRKRNASRAASAPPLRDHKGYALVRGGEPHESPTTLEHRQVAAAAVGRRLASGEIVHHINGQKAENQIANLAVLPNNVIHGAVHKYMERVGMFHSGLTDIRPEPLKFSTPVFWGGKYITVLDLLGAGVQRWTDERSVQNSVTGSPGTVPVIN